MMPVVRVPVLVMALLVLGGQASAQSQKVPVAGCTTDPSPVAGYECAKAYDGNASTQWRVQALPGDGQELHLNITPARRVKRLVVNWSVAPTGSRTYICVDNTDGNWRWINSVQGSQTTDDIVVDWGRDEWVGHEMFTCRAIIVETYSDAVAGIREINLYGPGVYTDYQILTKTIPIGPRNFQADKYMNISIAPMSLKRIVGLSAFIYGDDNSVHNLSTLTKWPLGSTFSQPHPAYCGLSGDGTNATEINLVTGSQFEHDNFNDPAKSPRGYVTIQYLSQDPEFRD